MIVADVNTMACLWFTSPHSVTVRNLLDKDKNWTAPPLWQSEFRNVLSNYMKFHQLPLLDALGIWKNAGELILAKNERLVSTAAVLFLVNESGCSAYDCEYVALAQQLNVKLITYDKQLIKNFPKIAMTAEQYLSAISE